MRKLLSISCSLIICMSWAASAHAQQIAEPPAASPTVDFKVDLSGNTVDSDEMATARALKQYDESMRNWSLPPEKLKEIADSSRYALSPQEKLRMGRNYDFNAPYSAKEMEWNRQRFSDRVADAIYPGFGRIETTHANGATSRLDYIYTRRCGSKGLGICWQYRFK